MERRNYSEGSIDQPFHVLMLPSLNHPNNKRKRFLFYDRCLDKDYLAKRQRALHPNEKKEEIKVDHQAPAKVPNPPLCNEGDCLIWSGASCVEKALVSCCEIPEDFDPKDIHSAFEGVGSLAHGQEVRFVGLLAKHCHTVSSRALALAILERTLEKDEQGDESSSSYDEDSHSSTETQEEYNPEEDKKIANTLSKRVNNCTINLRKRNRTCSTDSDRGHDIKPSTRLAKEGKKSEKNDAFPKTKVQEDINVSKQEKSGIANKPRNQGDFDCMQSFLLAGGLKILSAWLLEATTPIESSSSSTKSKQKKTKLKPSPFGQMLLPILSVLTNIPFDKKLVLESKINKHIRNLSKHLDGLVESFKDCKESDSLESLTDAVAGGSNIKEVQNALSLLKSTWKPHSNNSNIDLEIGFGSRINPCGDFKSKMRQQLEELRRYKSGEGLQPEWVRKNMVEAQKERAKKKTKRKPANEEHTARERQMEHDALKHKLKAAEEERKEHLRRFHEQMRKRKAEYTESHRQNKSVRWKDGLSSDLSRTRQLLEEVFVFDHTESDTTERNLLDLQEESESHKI